MQEPERHILAINSGSSSIKFGLFDTRDGLLQILEGAIEQIGEASATLWMKSSNHSENFSKPVNALNHTSAVAILMNWIEERGVGNALSAVGHRIVHGGPKYFEAQKVTSKMMTDLQGLIFFDPNHMPGEMLLCAAFQRQFPNVPQVACFDTEFHHTMPRVAQLLPIPRRYEKQGVHRYGFHGLSYSYLMEVLFSVAKPESAQDKVILAHLGGGASLAAVSANKPIDTSMSFTPNSGVPMGTRSGNLDPGLALYLAHTEGLDTDGFNEMVNFRSGLLGVSETSSNMRILLEQEVTDIRAAEAIELFCYEVKKCIGAFAAALGGLDTLVFSGGIGENSPVIRARICEGLQFLGIELNPKSNLTQAHTISVDASKVCVRVIATDETRMIAKIVCRVLGFSTNKETES